MCKTARPQTRTGSGWNRTRKAPSGSASAGTSTISWSMSSTLNLTWVCFAGSSETFTDLENSFRFLWLIPHLLLKLLSPSSTARQLKCIEVERFAWVSSSSNSDSSWSWCHFLYSFSWTLQAFMGEKRSQVRNCSCNGFGGKLRFLQ